MNDFFWLKNIEKFKIATEAEDITTATDSALKQTIGNRINDEDNSNNENNRPEEDLGNTDDIFGLKTSEDNEDPSSSNLKDNNERDENLENTNDIFGTNENSEDDASIDSNENNSDIDPNMNADDNTENPSVLDTQENLDLAFTDKNKVRDNMTQLYNIITGDIELLNNSINSIDKIETVQVVNSVLNHLRNAKDVLYKILTSDIKKLSYDEMLQKYITLKRIYELSIAMIDTYFKTNKDK